MVRVRSISSRWLTFYLFALTLVSGVWIGASAAHPFAWLAALLVAVASIIFDERLPLPAGVAPAGRDVVAAVVVAAPAFIFLFATWNQEFPYNGDQQFHNGAGIEALRVWWPWWWIAAVASMLFVFRRLRRNERSVAAFVAFALLIAAGLWWPSPFYFAGKYPGALHFFAVPLRALSVASPLNVGRLVNALAIPAWLLVLRPFVVGRRADVAALTIGGLMFWQKDDIYYFTSCYLEPWAVVLLLTAGEHLVRFGREGVWRPLLLLGAAAMVKEQYVSALAGVGLVYFPFRAGRREQLHHALIAAVAAAPFALFVAIHSVFKPWSTAAPAPFAQMLSMERVAAFGQWVALQFGVALPLVVIGAVALFAFALRGRRPFVTLMVVAVIDTAVLTSASELQRGPGYPRHDLLRLAILSIALAVLAEALSRRARIAWAALAAATFALNAFGLVPFLRGALFQSDSARNFTEHYDAPLFLPIREGIARAERDGWLRPGGKVDLLHGGKRMFIGFYPGPLVEQYPDLAARHRIAVRSFYGAPERCACTDDETTALAVFIRFTDAGFPFPRPRGAIEADEEQCAQTMRRTCARTVEVRNEGVRVGLIGKGWRRERDSNPR